MSVPVSIIDQVGFARWVVAGQQKKDPLPSAFYFYLQTWVNANPIIHARGMPGSTFDYVIRFFATGEEHARLPIALADIGYTLDELKALKAEGKTAKDLGNVILERGVAPESDSDDDDDDN